MSRRLTLLLVPALLAGAGCGGGSKDEATGKVYAQGAVERCLKKQGLALQPRAEQGIDFTAFWRDGRNSIDVAVERTPTDAADREQQWKSRAKDAGIQNIDSYYSRFGNVVVAYERLPGISHRRAVGRCLS